jgi:hypothetical protein
LPPLLETPISGGEPLFLTCSILSCSFPLMVLTRSLVLMVQSVDNALNHGRDDLADAALQFAIVSNRRAHRYVGGADWRNAERDQLGSVD